MKLLLPSPSIRKVISKLTKSLLTLWEIIWSLMYPRWRILKKCRISWLECMRLTTWAIFLLWRINSKKSRWKRVRSFMKISQLRYELLSAGEIIFDRELVLISPRGLPMMWETFITTINNNAKFSLIWWDIRQVRSRGV